MPNLFLELELSALTLNYVEDNKKFKYYVSIKRIFDLPLTGRGYH